MGRDHNNQIHDDFKHAKQYKSRWIKQAKEDYNFLVGDQWDDADRSKLESEGKPALTLNKIQALIFLISGIQRQNRTDYRAFPVGEEDSIKADAITYLLKDMMRNCDGEYKESEMFEDSIVCGEGWVEPYLDYTQDLVNGDMKFRSVSPLYVFPDPASREYDHSDARYIIKYTPNISEDQLIMLFPEKNNLIKEIEVKTAKQLLAGDDGYVVVRKEDDDYPELSEMIDDTVLDYDMLEYHHYQYRYKYLIVNLNNKDDVTYYENKKDAEEVLELKQEEGSYELITRYVKVPHITVQVNGIEIDTYENPFFPRYDKITLFPMYAHKTNAPIKKKELLVQGIVNSLKDPQREINKRRSQELHHLNTSTNSGWLNNEKNGFTDIDKVEKFGSTAGIVLNFKGEKPERVHPMPLSTGHEQLVQFANTDIREISGINTDLLASGGDSGDSGRAIHLRQQQGLMMIQRILDNFSRTKREIGRFLISQIGEIYTIKKAMRAVGDQWVKQHFEEPILVPRKNPQTGEPMINMQTGQQEMVPLMKDDGSMVMQFNERMAIAFFSMILEESDIDRYDVLVGEVATSETIKMANYSMLLEFLKYGVPIPPDIIVEESTMSDVTKEKIKRAFGAKMAQTSIAKAN